ncbi:hypothetical protein EYW49_21735 [Siculibacillus lacustris]|uniref:EF-hand domain-containing protein n=1 Tax=Siculibacillus lacustris TaxID=1549641 RepID=A0A4Q9VFN4_9HYPH|nr:hypothetical protein [Siculibacillus lacustris]TBW32772.1 hypothetical protein EYW49_21735 [Siculibacillus lacustris]
MCSAKTTCLGVALAMAAAIGPGVGQAADGGRLDRDPPAVLQAMIGVGVTVASVTERARTIFKRSDADGDGSLTAADGRLADSVAQTTMRAASVMNLFQFDLDGDGIVTEAEIRTILAFERRISGPRAPLAGGSSETLDARVRAFMVADADHDGRITLQEAQTAARNAIEATKSVAGTEAIIVELLDYAGNRNVGLSEQAFVDLVLERFKEIDADADGTLTREEINASTLRRQEIRRAAMAARRQAEEEATRRRAVPPEVQACELPKPSPEAAVVLLSAYESQSLSTTAIGTREVAVGTATVSVEQGEGPVWVLLLTHKPVIWRFTGAVGRIERAILLSSVDLANAGPESLAGATGLAREKITFGPPCLKPFTDARSIDSSRVLASVRKQTERDPVVAATYALSAVKVRVSVMSGQRFR